MNTQDLIRSAMRELGKRKKTMSPAAIEQRRAANKKSVAARKQKKLASN